ncbi:hypothetical protein A0J61_11193, partial [Choanephora cucurbitarum]
MLPKRIKRFWFRIDKILSPPIYPSLPIGEKTSKSSSAGRNAQRITAGELEYGCAECGRYNNQTKELCDSSFKMLKVLKDMIYNLYESAPTSLREFTLIGFLMF